MNARPDLRRRRTSPWARARCPQRARAAARIAAGDDAAMAESERRAPRKMQTAVTVIVFGVWAVTSDASGRSSGWRRARAAASRLEPCRRRSGRARRLLPGASACPAASTAPPRSCCSVPADPPTRAQFGVTLLERNSRNVRLTDTGDGISYEGCEAARSGRERCCRQSG